MPPKIGQNLEGTLKPPVTLPDYNVQKIQINWQSQLLIWLQAKVIRLKVVAKIRLRSRWGGSEV
jgi:hypothetical protein